MTETPQQTAAQGLGRGLTNYGDAGFALYLRRSFAKAMGFSGDSLRKPVIGIATSASGFNNCHRHFPDLVEAVKRGVLAAGGLPLDFPTISLGEVFLNPTSMMYRNLMAMDVEEMIAAQPMDAVVLLGACDKTVPALLMGALSANRPAIMLVGGPMLPMPYQGERLGACTDCRRFWGKYRAGEIDDARIEAIEGNLATTAGSCAVMGTASTMAALSEALGLTLPGTAAIPAVHADRLRAAEASGTRAVEMALSGGPLPRDLVTERSVENALRVLLAVGGSTNGILHLTALAGRAGVKVSLERLNALSDETPVLVDLKPTGQAYMSDLHAAGGLGAVMRALRPLLHLDAPTVTGETLGAWLEGDIWTDPAIVRPMTDPIQPQGGLVALFGSLAPKGAILKRSAADASLFERTARAVVFSSLADLAARIDDPDLDVEADDILVLQNAGPKSGAGMPEAGYLPIPAKLARRGVKDMLRLSDARMSGTAFGTVILHVSPEAAVGGPLALVRNGDRIRVSVAERRLDLLVADAELDARRATWSPPAETPARGYKRLFFDSVLQAEDGCDFDFLTFRPEGAETTAP